MISTAIAKTGNEGILPREKFISLIFTYPNPFKNMNESGIFGEYIDLGQIIVVETIFDGEGMETERFGEGVEVLLFG